MGNCYSTFQLLELPTDAVSANIYVNVGGTSELFYPIWNTFPLELVGNTCNTTEWYQTANLTLDSEIDSGLSHGYYFTYTDAAANVYTSTNYTFVCTINEYTLEQAIWAPAAAATTSVAPTVTLTTATSATDSSTAFVPAPTE